jgi:hypothetical protein
MLLTNTKGVIFSLLLLSSTSLFANSALQDARNGLSPESGLTTNTGTQDKVEEAKKGITNKKNKTNAKGKTNAKVKPKVEPKGKVIIRYVYVPNKEKVSSNTKLNNKDVAKLSSMVIEMRTLCNSMEKELNGVKKANKKNKSQK